MSDSRRRGSMELPPDLPEQTPSTAEDHESEMSLALEGTGIDRSCQDLPPDLPERRQLYSSAQDLLNHEASMREALMEFNDILDELNKADKMLAGIIKKEETFLKIALGTMGVLAVAFGVVAAPFTGGGSLALAAAATAGAGTAAVGSSAIKDILLYQKKINKIAEIVEAWVKKFLKIFQQLKKDLVKIKSLSEELQESTVMNVATVTLKKVEDVQKVLQQLSGSQKISEPLRRGGLVDSVGYLRTVCQPVRSRSDEVLTKLEELRSAVEDCRDQSMSSINELKPPSD